MLRAVHQPLTTARAGQDHLDQPHVPPPSGWHRMSATSSTPAAARPARRIDLRPPDIPRGPAGAALFRDPDLAAHVEPRAGTRQFRPACAGLVGVTRVPWRCGESSGTTCPLPCAGVFTNMWRAARHVSRYSALAIRYGLCYTRRANRVSQITYQPT